jgi:uncharacterized secreted repeat protein (TIGR03808 family)
VDRRSFRAGALGAAAATPAVAAVNTAGQSELRGTLDTAELGIDPHSRTDGSANLQHLLDMASNEDRQLFLPPGDVIVSELRLPARTRLAGVPGATRLIFGGGRFMISGEGAEIIDLAGLTIDGAGLPVDEAIPGILYLAECGSVSIDKCTLANSSVAGLALDRSAGRIARTTVRAAEHAGMRIIEARGMSIVDNIVDDCGNGGILVWRWSEGEDGTIVTGNRISNIGARAGGTGQNGNGINIFRADGAIVSNNRITDCAFTAIRANSANNVHITGNNCRGCGEVGIYSEFAFEGALIANNIVDGAATGISVVNFNDGGRIAVVSGNIVRNLTGVGPYVPEPPGFGTGIAIEADAAVTGNVIDGAPLHGMAIGWGPYLRDVAVTGNVIRSAPVGVAVTVVDGAGAAVISDNLISGAEKGAIVGMRWAETATGDLALTGARGYPHLQVERNRIS